MIIDIKEIIIVDTGNTNAKVYYIKSIVFIKTLIVISKSYVFPFQETIAMTSLYPFEIPFNHVIHEFRNVHMVMLYM